MWCEAPAVLAAMVSNELITQWPPEDANTKAWEKFTEKHGDEIVEIRGAVVAMMSEVGMTI